MPRVRWSGLPSSVSSSHVSARVLITRSATISVAWSSGISVQSLACGARYRTFVRRSAEFTSFSLAAPFGHSLPRETGESGSPSICVTFSSLTYTFWPQPTAQYGQTDCTTRSAVFVRGMSSSDVADCAARPSASGSPASWRRTGGIRRRGERATSHRLPRNGVQQHEGPVMKLTYGIRCRNRPRAGHDHVNAERPAGRSVRPRPRAGNRDRVARWGAHADGRRRRRDPRRVGHTDRLRSQDAERRVDRRAPEHRGGELLRSGAIARAGRRAEVEGLMIPAAVLILIVAGIVIGGATVLGAPVFALPVLAVLLLGWAATRFALRVLRRERRPEPVRFTAEDRATMVPSPSPSERAANRRRSAENARS